MEDQLGILISDGNERFSQLSKKKRDIDILVSYKKAEPHLIRVMKGEKIQPGSDDFYYFYFEDNDFANYRMIHPYSEGWLADDRPQPKYFCPATGAHFEVSDIVRRVAEL